MTKTVTPTTTDAVGTAYLDPATGDLYRLRSYGVDWTAEPFTGNADQPSYFAHRASGSSSTVTNLPDGVVPVWAPPITEPVLTLPNGTSIHREPAALPGRPWAIRTARKVLLDRWQTQERAVDAAALIDIGARVGDARAAVIARYGA